MTTPVLTEETPRDEIKILRSWLSDIKNKAEGLEQARHWAACAIIDADEIKAGETSLNKDRKP